MLARLGVRRPLIGKIVNTLRAKGERVKKRHELFLVDPELGILQKATRPFDTSANMHLE